jgi:hypothetical protein
MRYFRHHITIDNTTEKLKRRWSHGIDEMRCKEDGMAAKLTTLLALSALVAQIVCGQVAYYLQPLHYVCIIG